MPSMDVRQQDSPALQLGQMDTAAITIQKHYRRYQAQKRYQQQQEAAGTIQAHAKRFLGRQKAAREHEQAQKAARFKAVMARHQERIQQLELEKQRIRSLPRDQLDAYQARRHAAATTIQAWWRGSKQRQAVREQHPALLTLRPVICTSPTMGSPIAGGRKQQHLQQSAPAAGLYSEPSSASAAAAGHFAGHHASRTGALKSSQAGNINSSRVAGLLQAEFSSSSMLSAEASKLSAVGTAVLEGSEGPKRSNVLSAARRAVLDRQVQLRIDAFKASHTGSSKLAALRAAKDVTDDRLVHLLQDHQAAAADNLKAARRRQKLLQKAEVLYSQLQQLPQLSQLPDDVDAAQFPVPAAGTAVAERARQAHALALAEAKVGSRWWLPLKLLNQQHRDAAVDAAGSVQQQEWEQQESAWKANWARILQEEKQRGVGLGDEGRKVQRGVVIEQELGSESSWQAAA